MAVFAADSMPRPPEPGRGPMLEVEVTASDGVTLVCPRGELDLATAPRLRQALAEQTGAVVLDLRALEFIGADGLHLLLDADARARRDGLDLTVVPGRMTERLLALMGLRERFNLRAEWP